jgi:hypothetical protein
MLSGSPSGASPDHPAEHQGVTAVVASVTGAFEAALTVLHAQLERAEQGRDEERQRADALRDQIALLNIEMAATRAGLEAERDAANAAAQVATQAVDQLRQAGMMPGAGGGAGRGSDRRGVAREMALPPPTLATLVLRHNERIKLSAGALDRLALVVVSAGYLGPVLNNGWTLSTKVVAASLVVFFQATQWREIAVFCVTPLLLLLFIGGFGRAVSRAETTRLDEVIDAARGTTHPTAPRRIPRTARLRPRRHRSGVRREPEGRGSTGRPSVSGPGSGRWVAGSKPQHAQRATGRGTIARPGQQLLWCLDDGGAVATLTVLVLSPRWLRPSSTPPAPVTGPPLRAARRPRARSLPGTGGPTAPTRCPRLPRP